RRASDLDRQDVRMLEHADHVRFGHEHLARHARAIFVVRLEVVHLDRDVPSVIRDVGAVDHPCAAPADLLDDDVFATALGNTLLARRGALCHWGAQLVHEVLTIAWLTRDALPRAGSLLRTRPR